ncbi:hypothetical protein HETIRDRAFT_446351, partial [Heterobasidion irregulare TC 32-1]
MGDYAACFEAICRSVERLPKPDVNPSFSSQLYTRLAKSLSYGVRSGTISSDVLQQSSGAIQALERKFNEALSKSSEVPRDTVRAWKDWKRVEKEIEAVSRGRDAAQDRLVRIPIAKKAADPVLEYCTLGQDDIMSIIQDWGPEEDVDTNPLDLRKMKYLRLSCLAFLFGGVGDGLHQKYLKLTKAKQDSFKVNITLLDIHPKTLARDLCIFALLEQSLEMPNNEEKEAEIKATIFYAFRDIVKDQIKRLNMRPPQLLVWLHIGIFDYHDIKQPKTFASNVMEDPGNVSTYRDNINQRREEERQDVEGAVGAMQDQDVISSAEPHMTEPLPTDPKRRAEWLKLAKSVLVDIMLDPDGMGPGSPLKFLEGGSWGLKNTRLSKQSVKKVNAHIRETWKPNPSFFDSVHEREIGYPRIIMDPFVFVRSIHQFAERMGLLNNKIDEDFPSLCVTEIFFDAVVDAFKAFQGCIQIEILLGDLSQELAKTRLPGHRSRPGHFPKSYTRAWLSNVPDYTHGPLNTAVYTLPSLENESDTAVAANCLLNTSVWEGGDRFCYNVSFPSHWLTEYPQQVLAGSLTSEVAIYRGQLPIPLSDDTCMPRPLASGLRECSRLVVRGASLPDDFAKAFDEIGSFEALVPRHKFTPRTAMNLVSPFDPVMALMFYKPGSYQPDNIAKRTNKVLEGNIVKKLGELYILTTVDEFDMWNGFIRCRMSKERVKMMKAEGCATYSCAQVVGDNDYLTGQLLAQARRVIYNSLEPYLRCQRFVRVEKVAKHAMLKNWGRDLGKLGWMLDSVVSAFQSVPSLRSAVLPLELNVTGNKSELIGHSTVYVPFPATS